MTVFGISLASRPVWLAALGTGIVALAAIVVFGANRADSRAAATASLSCDATTLTFGESLSCLVASDDDVTVDWGDGTSSPGAGDHVAVPAAVGPTTVRVLDGETVLARHVVDIVPDISIDCDLGLPLPVYELAAGPSAAGAPYDYVYLDDGGTKVSPGDAGYPANLGEMLAMERVVVEEAPIVGLCRSESAAVDTLDGSVIWTVESPWYEPYSTTSRNITPGTPAHWDGVQPIDVTVTVDVDGFEASERIGVYFGGCG